MTGHLYGFLQLCKGVTQFEMFPNSSKEPAVVTSFPYLMTQRFRRAEQSEMLIVDADSIQVIPQR